MKKKRKLTQEQFNKKIEKISQKAQALAQKQGRLWLQLEELKDRAHEQGDIVNPYRDRSDRSCISEINLGDMMA